MGLDHKVCYCYNVSFRKLWSFACRERLQRPSQMSGCLGAGTGCGWCIPMLKRIFDAAHAQQAEPPCLDMTPEEYAERRQNYIRDKEPKNRF